jgi:hypothetical protein
VNIGFEDLLYCYKEGHVVILAAVVAWRATMFTLSAIVLKTLAMLFVPFASLALIAGLGNIHLPHPGHRARH